MIQKLVVADTDRAHIQRIRECLRPIKALDMIGSAATGNEALRLVLDKSVDILITDVLLPGMDGIMLLKDLRRAGRCPTVIVCTGFYSGQLVESVCRYGASYVLYKPLDYRRLPEVIENCCAFAKRRFATVVDSEAQENVDRTVLMRRLLLKMGIPARLTGSLYLLEAMTCLSHDPSLMRNLTKGLYAEVSQRLQSTPSQVERCLRPAIAIGYERGDLKSRFSRLPSNRAFLEYLLQQVEAAEYEASRRESVL